MDQESARIELQNPALPPERLAEIAQVFPALRAQVVSHPSMYPGLWSWLGSLGDTKVTAAMYALTTSSEPAGYTGPQASEDPVASTAPPTPGGSGDGRRKWLIPVIASIVAVALVVGGGFWWFNRGGAGGSSNAKIGSEEAVAAGVKVAARLSGNDEKVAEWQAVAGPELFYYAFGEDDISKTAEGEPFINNEVIIEVAADEDGLVDPESSLEVVEAVARDLDARVVGVDGYSGSYQLLLAEEFSAEGLTELAERAGGLDGVKGATPNFLAPLNFTSESPAGHDQGGQDGSGSSGSWGMQAVGAPAIWDAVDSEALDLQQVTVGVFDEFYADGWPEDLPKPKASFISPLPMPEAPADHSNLESDAHGLHVAETLAADPLQPTGVRGVAPNVELVVAGPHWVWYQDGWTERAGWIRTGDWYSTELYLSFLAESDTQIINMSVGQTIGSGPNAFNSTPFGVRAEDWADILSEALAQRSGNSVDQHTDFLVVKAAGNDACTEAAVNEGINSCKEVGAPDASGGSGEGGLKAQAQHLADEGSPELRDSLLTVGAAGPVSEEEGLTVYDKSTAGVDVLAPESANGSGTSMAAPHVSGLAAVLFGINTDLTAPQIKRIIEATANTSPELYWNETGEPYPTPEKLDHNAPLVNGAAAVQAALLSVPTDGSPGVANDFEALLEQIANGGLETKAGVSVPAQLLGTWCPPAQLSSTASPDACFNLETYFDGNPNASIPAAEPVNDLNVLTPVDPYGRETTQSAFDVCSKEDCEEGEGLYNLTYYPPGAAWECLSDAPSDSCPAEPETIAPDHDISYPRIVQTYRVESGEMVQSEPYLLDLRVPVTSWSDYTTLPFVESAQPTGMDLTQIATGDFSSIAGYWSPHQDRVLCAEFQEDSSFKVGGCGTDIEVLRAMSGTGLIPDPTWSEFPFTEPAQAIRVSDTQLQLVWTVLNYGAGGRPAIYVMYFEKANGTTEDRLSGMSVACMTSNCGGAIGDGGEWLWPFSEDNVTWLYRE